MKRVWIRRAISSIAALCLLDAFIEPYLLKVDHLSHNNARLRAHVRIAHVSDLHVQSFGLRERSLLAALEREKPDVIAITGDTVDGGDLEVARPLISAMRAPLGVFAVAGNWEHWRPVGGDQAAFYASAGARYLRNESVRVRSDLVIVGLDGTLSGNPDPHAAHSLGAGLRLALFHAPTGIEAVSRCRSRARRSHPRRSGAGPLLRTLVASAGIGRVRPRLLST